MRRRVVLIAAAVVLNCSMNAFADSSQQDNNVHPGKMDTKETLVEESDEGDISQISEILSEDIDEMKNTETSAMQEETIEIPDTVEIPDTTDMQEETTEIPETTAIEEETTEIPDTSIMQEETAEIPETTVISEEITQEESKATDETLIEESDEVTMPEDFSQGETMEMDKELLEVVTSEDNYIYNVSLPTKTMAYLDPGNFSGRGQVFSEEYIVENHGNTDVAIKIKGIDIVSHSTENLYEFTKEKITDSQSAIRKLNVNMVWKNESENIEKVLNVIEGAPDEYVLLLKAAEYDENGSYIGLNDGSTGTFCFTGTLNSNADIVWEDGDITVHFDYEIVYAEGEESLISETESIESIESETMETKNTKS